MEIFLDGPPEKFTSACSKLPDAFKYLRRIADWQHLVLPRSRRLPPPATAAIEDVSSGDGPKVEKSAQDSDDDGGQSTDGCCGDRAPHEARAGPESNPPPLEG